MITAIFIGGPWDGYRREIAQQQTTYTVAVAVAREPLMPPPFAEAPPVLSDTYVYREYRPLGMGAIIVFIPNDLEGDPWPYLREQLLMGYAPQRYKG